MLDWNSVPSPIEGVAFWGTRDHRQSFAISCDQGFSGWDRFNRYVLSVCALAREPSDICESDVFELGTYDTLDEAKGAAEAYSESISHGRRLVH